MKIVDNCKVSPEEAMEILAKHNIIVTRIQAVKILAFMDSLATIIVKQYLQM